YIQEMNRRVLSKHDIMTVGECSGVTLEEAKKYASLSGKELNMVFQFEHMGADDHPVYGKWTTEKGDLRKLKAVLAKWEDGLEGIAWNSLFWDNHDQPRIVSRWGNDSSEYREKSAKMLATALHLMKGTPYIFQGEELGMTNYPWENTEEMDDIESLGNYHQIVEKGVQPEREAFKALCFKTRDNARTPMQWDDTENAGFSTGTPWLKVNPNYREINAAEQEKRPDSVYNYYKKLIELRRKSGESELIVYGSYELLEPENEALYIYKRVLGEREMLVVCNFSEKEQTYGLPAAFEASSVLIGNYPDRNGAEGSIRAYEAFALVK
ncbi:MAG: alpha-glucosidase C-terminal domain-containing protein, partial [Lachnospiraceae bacterium]|nr:alpha-glucosidase C-terminal domain-containing protein [Lachnospiraceae bacterium]